MTDYNDTTYKSEMSVPTGSDDQSRPHLPTRYRNLAKLCDGGMAGVWQADEVDDQGEIVRQVAIKFVSGGMNRRALSNSGKN